MLQKLTAQLLQTKHLHIPYVGNFHMEDHAAVLHFADRLLHPPYASITFKPIDGEATNDEAGPNFSNDLVRFGRDVKTGLTTSPFFWTGIGTLRIENGQVVFQPLDTLSLSPVAANKVLRENRQHQILVGDQQQSSADISFIGEGIERKKTWIWIGWVILLIAMLVVAFIFYKEGTSFGSKIKAGTALLHMLPPSYYS